MPFLLRDHKKVSISILFQKVFLGWKLSPLINGGVGGWAAVGIKNVLVGKKIEKLISGADVY